MNQTGKKEKMTIIVKSFVFDQTQNMSEIICVWSKAKHQNNLNLLDIYYREELPHHPRRGGILLMAEKF